MNYIYLPRRVRNCEPPNNAKWTLFDIEQKLYSFNSFKIYVYVDNNNTVFMKPYQLYTSREFEQLFGFGIMCEGYDENKVVQITEPKNYFTNFQ